MTDDAIAKSSLEKHATSLVIQNLNKAADLCGAIPALLDSDYDGAVPAAKALADAIYGLLDEAQNLIRAD